MDESTSSSPSRERPTVIPSTNPIVPPMKRPTAARVRETPS